MFMDESGAADLDKTELWVRGFWLAMSAVPAAWSALAEDERTQVLVEPFATFIDTGLNDDEPLPGNIDEIRQNSAAFIPAYCPLCANSPSSVPPVPPPALPERQAAARPVPADQAKSTNAAAA